MLFAVNTSRFSRLFCYLAFFACGLTSGPIHAAVDLVKVDKSEREMLLLDGDTVVKRYRISLGENPQGHKQQEGDEKTPEGRYSLDYINEQSSFYRSMHISYPNAADKAAAKARGVSPGGFIMIHGQPNRLPGPLSIPKRFDWTDGCIAITNAEMDEFLSLVPVGTAIEISW